MDRDHLDQDRLVLLALGEERTDDTEDGHLTACGYCRAEVEELRAVVTVSRESGPLRDLPPPPEHVWAAIAESIAAAPANGAPTNEAPANGAPANVVPMRRRRGPRWVVPLMAAAAAAVVAVVGTVVVQNALTPDPVVQAQTDLGPLPDAPSCGPSYARVLDGDRLHVHVTCPVPGEEAYEVWLLDPATAQSGLKMVSLGTMGGRTDQIFPLDPGVDLDRYSVVDVSAEPRDGNPLHSGKSLLRGTLR